MNFELARVIRPHQQVFEHDRTLRRFNFEAHEVTFFDSVVSRMFLVHVNVAGSSDDALLQLNGAMGTDQDTAGSAFDITAMTNRGIDAE